MPSKIHHLGVGYEPHVDEIDGKLIYSIPVDSSFVSLDFEFEINAAALKVLKNDAYRYAVLYTVLHTLIQNTFGPGLVGTDVKPRKYTQQEFDDVTSVILFSPASELESFINVFSKDHNVVLKVYIDQTMRNHAANNSK